MDQNTAEKLHRLEQTLRRDDIYRAYEASARELEHRFAGIAEALPPHQREILVGYGECLRLMQLRLMTIACEQMSFHTK